MTEEYEVIWMATKNSAIVVLLGYLIYWVIRRNWQTWRSWSRPKLGWVKNFSINSYASMRANPQPAQKLLCYLSLVCSFFGVAVPVFGYHSYLKMQNMTWGNPYFFELCAIQMIGPITLFLLSGCLLFLRIHGKRAPRVMMAFSPLAAFFTLWISGDVSHEFSHAIFDECGGYDLLLIYPLSLLVIMQSIVFYSQSISGHARP